MSEEMFAGHCSDATTMHPPRGLQFILGTENKPDIVDTIVMANLVSSSSCFVHLKFSYLLQEIN